MKGEDLLFLDHPNTALTTDDHDRYTKLGLTRAPFTSVDVFAPPPRRRIPPSPATVTSRTEGVTSVFWTIQQFCEDELLPFLFADAEDDRQRYDGHCTTSPSGSPSTPSPPATAVHRRPAHCARSGSWSS